MKVEDLPHYTYDDYARWEGHWEIIHGIPYAMTPSPSITHQEIALRISGQLYRLLAGCKRCKALLPVDWQVTEETVVQPDVLVVCGDNIDENKLLISPILVFEVLSPATRRKDRSLKYRLYEEAGVRYFCIIDPETNSAEIYELQGKEYEKSVDSQDGKITFDLGPCKIAFDFNEVFAF